MMKELKRLCVFVAFAIAAVTMQAQPRISYMIPDIGTTRFATYVEIIGPYNALPPNYFGADGLYDNNAGSTVRVRPFRESDTQYVKVGPCVVSWSGRMISAHFFVTPEANPDNSLWSALSPTWKIPIVVEVNGVRSNVDTFYIVKPFAFGDKRLDTKRVLGEGTMGIRSKRGAMLMDSMLLAENTVYTFDTQDRDPNTPGNQGYLPVVMLVKGNIRTKGVKLVASANGMDAGPGGGGGGGGYANSNIGGGGSNRGTAGGIGYTGGGPGGFNILNPFTPGGEKRTPGVGTGEAITSGVIGSKSLNNNPGGNSFSGWENAGGGTGHPFGASGIACTGNQNTCDAAGGYGGGSGASEGRAGGAGGYSAQGEGVNQGGRIHGNAQLMPLAGGSGGASGNPAGISTISGAGGGGGGAVSIHAQYMFDFDVYAEGKFGPREAIKGGGGSGGGIILGARIDGSRLSPQVSGLKDLVTDNGGSLGRIRVDGFGPLQVFSRGPVTDTVTAVLRKFQMIGAGDQNPIEVWVRSEHVGWQLNTTITTFNGNGFFSVPITLPGTDTLFYVMLAQKTAAPNSAAYTAVPTHVLSQSAWSILRIFGPPKIDAVQTVNMGVHRCPNTVLTKTITIYNRGESPLEIRKPTWQNGNGFQIITPTVFPDTVRRFDSTTYVIEFSPLAGQSGVINDVLILDNNDPVTARNPYKINVTATVESVDLNFTYKGLVKDTIDLGSICLGSAIAENVTITNIGTGTLTVASARSLNPSVVSATTTAPQILAPGATSALTLGGSLRTVGPVVVAIVVTVDECPRPETLYVKLVGVEPDLVLIGTTQFGDVRVGQTRRVLVEIRNNGSSDLSIPSLPPAPAPFSIISAIPAVPIILSPGESIIVTFEYAPLAVGDDSATLEFTSEVVGGSCGDTVVIALAGRGVQEAIELDKNQIVFGDVNSCTVVVDSVTVINKGTADVVLFYPAYLNGPDAASFTIRTQPINDDTLSPGESATYVIEFSGGTAAVRVHTAILSIRTNSTRQNQLDIPVSAHRIALDLTGPSAVNLGTVAVGASAPTLVTFTNNSSTPLSIANVTSDIPIVSVTPTSGTVAPGGTIDFTITFAPQAEGAATATIWIIIDAPCPDSVMLIARGIGAAGSIAAPNSVYFGTLTDCEQRRDSVSYVNNSEVPVDLIDVAITGVDAQLFSIVNPGAANNITLAPGEQVTVYVVFDPRSYADGPRTAQLVLRVRLNNQPVPFVTELTGNRRTSLPSTPVEVTFGSIDIGTTSSQIVSVVNSTTAPVHITGAFLRNTSLGVFTILPSNVPATLAPGERFDVQVFFKPTAQQGYVDSIVITFDQPCQDERVIPVSGTGRLNVEVSVILPKHTMLPTSDDETLPVKAKVAIGGIDLTGATLRMTMKYASSLFVVRTISTGAILRNEVVGGETFVEVQVGNLTATTTESVIFELQGQATIGPIDSSAFVITDATLISPTVTPSVRREDGFLKIAICEQGGPRLIQRAGTLAIKVSPNPASDEVAMSVDLVEKGEHSLQVLSLTGEELDYVQWQAEGTGTSFSHTLNTNRIPAGAYQVILQTPSRRRVTSLSIIH